jgi:hypothetical protein
MRFYAGAFILLVSVSLAHAAALGTPSPGYVYFHHAGASLASHNEAVEACAHDASLTFGPSVGDTKGLVGSLINGSEEDSLAHVTFTANVENCMVVQGWDVVQLDDAEGASLAKLDAAAQAAALAPWVGSAAIHGKIVRRYEPADKLDPAASSYGTRADDSLSLTSDLDNVRQRTAVSAHDAVRPAFQVIEPAKDPA